MSFLKTWMHEIAMLLVSVWYALGTDGQNGLINFAKNAISNHGWSAGILVVGSVVVARLRAVPGDLPPTAGPGSGPGMAAKSSAAGPVVVLTLLLGLGLTACNAVSTYRDTIATSYGYLIWAQGTYGTQCKANPAAATCALITRAIGLHNAAVDGLNAYCNGPALAGNAAWTQGGPCSPISGLQGALVAAMAALSPVIPDLKLLATGQSQPKVTAERLRYGPSTQDALLSARLISQEGL